MNRKRTRASSLTDARTRRRLERDDNRPPTPPRLPPPPAVAVDTTPPSFMCGNCGKVILSTADHIIIRPCAHTLCTFCAFNSHVQRGIANHTCPVTVCNRPSVSFDYVHNGNYSESLTKTVPEDDDYVKSVFPLEWLKTHHKEELTAGHTATAITFTRVCRKEDGVLRVVARTSTFVTKSKDKKKGSPLEILDPERAVKEFGTVFSLFHQLLSATSPFHTSDPTLEPVLHPREFLEMRCGNPLFLDIALFAMATGQPTVDKEKCLTPNNQDYQRQFLASIISSDILRRINTHAPGPFQLLFGDLLDRQCVTQDFRDFCTTCQLAPSRKYSRKEKSLKVIQHLTDGLFLKPRELLIILFDNVGFRVIGRHAGYDQWIAMNYIVVTERDLIAAGFYEEDVTKRICRELKHDWDAITKEISVDDADDLVNKVVGIQQKDYDRLSECTLENIHFVLEHLHILDNTNKEVKVSFPRFDRIVCENTRKKMDHLNENGHPTHPTVERPRVNKSVVLPREHIPNDVINHLGGRNILNRVTNAGIVEQINNDHIDEEEDYSDMLDDEEDYSDMFDDDEDDDDGDDDDGDDDDNDNEDNDAGVINRYTMNNSKLQVLHDDLSKTDTIHEILQYQKRSWEEQRKGWVDEEHLDDEPPVGDIIMGSGCDGQPARAVRRLLENDTAGQYHKNTFCSFGGLHTVMKGLNASGEYFEEYLKDIFRAFRDTAAKVDWILKPSDPRQRENDYSWYLLASYAVAAKNLSEQEDRPVSSVEVNDFMLQRAKDYPLCAFALLELRIGTVMKLMRNSERLGIRGCVDTFLTAIRLILPLFAVTHKTDYVYLCQDLLKWYYCASDAQKIVYEQFIFTQLTAWGNAIFHDYHVELNVMNIREYCGKTHYAGIDLDMEVVAATLPNSNSVNNQTRTLHNKDSKSNSTRSRTCDTLSDDDASCPYYMIFDHLYSMMIWSTTEAPKIRRANSSTTIDCNDSDLQVPGGGALHADILTAITGKGPERVKEHFKAYFIQPGIRKKSDKTVDLSKINVTVAGTKQKMDDQVIIKTSTNAADFKEHRLSKKIIYNEIKNMIKKEKKRKDRVNIPAIPKFEVNKKVLAEFLVKWRLKVFAKHKSLERKIKDKITASFTGRSLPASRKRIV